MALPTTFPEQNFVLKGGPAADFGTEHDVLDLPTYRGDNVQISRWRLTWRERLQALFNGHVWLHVVTPGAHPPIGVHFDRTPFAQPTKEASNAAS